jgi:hypothetical protein
LAIFFAFLIRDADKDKEAAEYLEDDDLELSGDEEYLHSIKQSPFVLRSQHQVHRLNDGELVWARNQRMKEMQMWLIIREIISYCSFLILISLVTYSNLNLNSSLQVQHLRKFFYNSRQIDQNFAKISTVDQYWNWLENSFVSNILAQEWYNGEPPRNLSGFANDKASRLIGWAIMRQLRIKTELCHTQKISSICEYDYNFFNEEKSSFEPGWVNQTTRVSNSSIDRAFMYQTGDQLDTEIYTGEHGIYSSGGYAYEYRGRLSDLQSNLSELHQFDWIDSQTRIVIIQLTLYNPNVQLFTSVILAVEFLSTGGLIPQSQFEPIFFQGSISLLSFHSKFLCLVCTSIFQLICLIIYMFFVVYYMIMTIQHLFQLKTSYFLHFWSYIDLGIIGCSWGIVGIYIWRYRESIRISNLFNQTNGYVYINLQTTAYLSEILTYLLGFGCFFGTIKFLRLCRFHQRSILFTKTLHYARKDLIAFSLMFSIVFMAFLTLFYLLFVSKIWTCSTLLNTAQMLFQMMSMKYDTRELQTTAPALGPLCFSLFIILVVFVCMNMFITIIIDSFRIVREHTKTNHNEDYEVLRFMIGRFQRWIGKKDYLLTRHCKLFYV